MTLVFKTVESPRFLKGDIFTVAASFSLIVMVFVMLTFYKRQERKDARIHGVVLFNSTVGEAVDTDEVSEISESDEKLREL